MEDNMQLKNKNFLANVQNLYIYVYVCKLPQWLLTLKRKLDFIISLYKKVSVHSFLEDIMGAA